MPPPRRRLAAAGRRGRRRAGDLARGRRRGRRAGGARVAPGRRGRARGSETGDGGVLLQRDVRGRQRRDRVTGGNPGCWLVSSSGGGRGRVPRLRRRRLGPALRGVVATPRLLVGVVGLPRGGVLGGSGRGLAGLVGGHGGGRCGAGAVLLRVLLRGGLAGVVGLPGGRRAGPTVRSAWGLHRSSPNSAPRSPLNLHPPRRAAFRFRPGSRAFSGVSHP